MVPLAVAGEKRKVLETAAEEGEKFSVAVDDLLAWLASTRSHLESLDPVSGDKDRLAKQSRDHEVRTIVSNPSRGAVACFSIPGP